MDACVKACIFQNGGFLVKLAELFNVIKQCHNVICDKKRKEKESYTNVDQSLGHYSEKAIKNK